MEITKVLGTVAMVPKGEYDAEEYYEYLNVVTYNGSSYMAKKSSTGVLPTNDEYWQLCSEKGDKGDKGETPIKGVDYYTQQDIDNLEATLSNDVQEEVINQVGNITDGTPLTASSVSGMTDTTRLYVNTTDGYVYYYNGTTWVQGWVYQATSFPELTDVRTSYTGKVYNNAGNSVRSQTSEIALNTGVPVYNMSVRNINQNYYNYGSVNQGDEIIFKIQDFTNTPNVFAVYGQINEGDSSSQLEQLIYTNNINKINEYKENYTRIAINKNYYNIRFFFQYTGTGTSQNANVMIFKASDKNLNNRIFSIENDIISLNDIGENVDTIEKETGINIINLSTKNVNANYYDYGSVSKNDTLVYKIIDFTGTPNTFVIYARVSDSSSWEILVNLNTPELLENAKNNYQTLTFTKNYNYVRLYMAYNGTGLAETSSVLANLLSDDNLLSLSISNENQIKNIKTSVGNDIYKIFRKVVCCGDSFTAGYISVGGQVSQFNENYAWPHFMATSSNNEYKNCGVSGTTCKTWQSNQYGLSKCRSFGTVQAYITGWGINDSNSSVDVYLPVGTVDDIGTNNDTYYAQYSKVIRELHEISPDAIIFMQTCPDNNTSRYNPYNEAIRTIASLYHDTYHTHCIDLVEYQDLYNQLSVSGDYIGSHFTAIGYEQFAEILKLAISDYIKNNISDFQKVAFIPYD